MPKYAPPPGYQLDGRSGLYYSQTVTPQPDGNRLHQVVWFNSETGQYAQSSYSVDAAAGRGRKAPSSRKKRRILPIVLSFILVLGICGITAVWLLRPQNKAELLATTAEENAQYGTLLVAYEDWVFYADPAMGGALCVLDTVDKKSRSIFVADMPVANLGIMDDTLYFTDLAGSFISKTQADGSVVNRAFPEDMQNLTGYLDVATRSDTLHLGGTLYRADGLKRFLESRGKEPLQISVISEAGSYHYNVLATENSIKSVERIVTQTSDPALAVIPTAATVAQQPTSTKLSTMVYTGDTAPQMIQLDALPHNPDKPVDASMYDKFVDGLGLVYSKVENSYFSETPVEKNWMEEEHYKKLRQELDRPKGHQISSVMQIGDMIYYDSYAQTGDASEGFTSALQVKNTFTGELTTFTDAGDMKRAGDKIFFKDNRSGLLMVLDGGSGGEVKAVSSTPIGNYVINSRGDIEFDYVDKQGKILPGIFSLKDHEAAYLFLKSGAPDTQADTPYYVHLNPPNILFDNVDDWEKRNSWTGNYARGNLINPFKDDVNMQMAYKMGYDSAGNPVWIQEAWEAGVGTRKETRSFAPAVDVVNGDKMRAILETYNVALRKTTEELAKEYPETDFSKLPKYDDVLEDYEPEEGYDWFGSPLPKPLLGKSLEKDEDTTEISQSEDEPKEDEPKEDEPKTDKPKEDKPNKSNNNSIIAERIDGECKIIDYEVSSEGSLMELGKEYTAAESKSIRAEAGEESWVKLKLNNTDTLILFHKAFAKIFVDGDPSKFDVDARSYIFDTKEEVEIKYADRFTIKAKGTIVIAGVVGYTEVYLFDGTADLYDLEGNLIDSFKKDTYSIVRMDPGEPPKFWIEVQSNADLLQDLIIVQKAKDDEILSKYLN